MKVRQIPLLLMWMATGVSAWGGLIPPALYSGGVGNSGATPIFHSAGTYTADTGVVTVAGTPSATVDVSGFLDGAHSFFQGNGHIEYYFQFSGPDGPLPVSIDVHLLLTEDDFAFFGTGSFTLEGVDHVCVGPVSGCPAGEITTTLHETLSANSVYHVILDGYIHGSSNNHGAAHVLVDPVIYLDPGFAGAQAYTFDQSAGIGNSAASTPEPGTFGAGALALLALAARRIRVRRRR